MFRAVNASAAAANSPAPSASSRPRAASRSISRRGSLPGPRSWRASQPPAGTLGTRAAAGACPAAAIPPSVHRMPRCEAADRIITGTTLGEHDRLRGRSATTPTPRCLYGRGALRLRRRCLSAARRAARRPRARPQPRRRRKRPPRKAQQCSPAELSALSVKRATPPRLSVSGLWPSVVLTWRAEDRRPSPHGGGSLAASKVNAATGIPFIRALSTVSWVPALALT